MSERADTPRTRSARRSADALRRPRVRAGAVIAIALLVGFGVWLLVRDDGSSTTATPTGTSTTSARAPSVPVSESGLQTLAGAVGQPIYWAGPMSGMTYELTNTSSNQVYVRYLPDGVDIGSRDPYLTIGTYPMTNAFDVTTTVSKEPTSTTIPVENGGVAFYSTKAPTHVYVAYPGSNYQVEVYDPSPEHAHEVVASGQVVAVEPASGGSGTAGGAHLVTRDELSALAASIGHPLYWIGPEDGTSYELTSLDNGRIFVRYLPEGAAVGSRSPYLTVGTYPVKDAFIVTSAQSVKAGQVAIPIGGGGVAFYSKAAPTHVYVAYPDSGYQIEVYDPEAGRAQELVQSGSVEPVD